MADYKTPQWLLPNEKNLAYPAAGDGITGSGLSEDRHSLYSMDFTGTKTINYSTPVDLGVVSTFSFWMNINVGTTGALFGNTTAVNPTYEYVVYYSGSQFFFKIAGAYADFPNAAAAISTGQWHHVAFVRPSENEVQCYIDSVLTDTITSWNGTPGSNPIKFDLIGSRPGGGLSYSGKIDEICGFKRALSGTEVAALSVADAPANVMALPDKPYVYYPLGEQAQMGSANWSFPNGSLQSHVVDFDGSGDKIDLSSSIDLGTINTTSLWVRNEVSQDRTLLGEDSYGIDYYILGGYNNLILRIGSSFMVFTTGSTPIIPINSNWTHLAFVRNGDTVTCYINGSPIGSSSTWTGGSPGSTTTKFDTIGAKTTGSTSWLGKMSNVAVWNSDQSTNIDNIYNNGSPQSTYTATPTAWWKLNAANSSYVYPWLISMTGNTDYASGNGCFTSGGVLKWIDTNSQLLSEDEYFTFTTQEVNYSGSITLSTTGGNYQSSSSQLEYSLEYKVDQGSWTVWKTQVVSSGTSNTAWTATDVVVNPTSSVKVRLRATGGLFGSSQFTLNDVTIGGLYTETFAVDGIGYTNNTITQPPVDWTFIDTETPAPNYTSALSFDGTNQRIELASDSDLGINSTVSVWINSDIPIAALNDIILGYDLGYILYINNNLIYIFVDGNLQSFNHNSMVAGEWYNITVVRTGDSVEVFQNGVSLGTQTGYGTSVNTIFNQIGARSGGGFSFNGKISNVSAFNSSLSSAQVQTLYNNGTPETAISFSPTSWWKLNNTTTGIQDSGSASNNGTNNGATQVATNVLISNNGESDTLPTSALTPSDLQFESPYSNYSLSFDGVNDLLLVPNASTQFAELDGLDTFSVSMWVKPDSSPVSSTMGLFGLPKTGWNLNLAANYIPSSNSISVEVNSAGGNDYSNTSVTLSTSSWSHLVFVFDRINESGSDRIKLYINGVSYANASAGNWTQIASAGSFPFVIGGYYQGNSGVGGATEWTGFIDETALWNSALTQAQVNQIYNNGYPNDITSLSPSNWWRLGEDAYFVNNFVTIPNQVTGGQTGTGSGTQTAILVGDAPGSYANGSGINLAVEDRIGDAPESTANSVSINMIPSNRISYPAGYVPTQVDNAFSMDFDGVGDYIETSFTPPTGASARTISVWFYADNSVFRNICGYGTAASNQGFDIVNYTSNTVGVHLFGTAILASGTYNASAWNHYVVTYDGTTLRGYLNGVAVATSTNTVNTGTTVNFKIARGAYTTANHFNGKIDEVAIFDYALSERQIKQDIYNGTTTGKTADLNNISNLTAPVAWYRMGD